MSIESLFWLMDLIQAMLDNRTYEYSDGIVRVFTTKEQYGSEANKNLKVWSKLHIEAARPYYKGTEFLSHRHGLVRLVLDVQREDYHNTRLGRVYEFVRCMADDHFHKMEYESKVTYLDLVYHFGKEQQKLAMEMLKPMSDRVSYTIGGTSGELRVSTWEIPNEKQIREWDVDNKVYELELVK
jgi:hypothetical protein